jgi:flagellar biosynthesis/type III secretory pathway protein FliH
MSSSYNDGHQAGVRDATEMGAKRWSEGRQEGYGAGYRDGHADGVESGWKECGAKTWSQGYEAGLLAARCELAAASKMHRLRSAVKSMLQVEF